MSAFRQLLRDHSLSAFQDVQPFLKAAPYHLKVKELSTGLGGNAPLYLVKYSARKSLRCPAVWQSRGLVLEQDTNRVVSFAFEQFVPTEKVCIARPASQPKYKGNLASSAPEETLECTEKADGALVKVVRMRGLDKDILLSTNNSIDGRLVKMGSIEGPTFWEAFEDAGGLRLSYKPGLCYIFELLHPLLPSVIRADRPGLVHLGTRRIDGGSTAAGSPTGAGAGAAAGAGTGSWGARNANEPHELCYPEVASAQLHDEGYLAGVQRLRPLRYVRPTIRMDQAHALPWDTEGFVLLHKGSRVRTKLKSRAFEACHKLCMRERNFAALQEEQDSDDEGDADDALALKVAISLHKARTPLAHLPPSVADRVAQQEEALLATLARVATMAAWAQRLQGSQRSRLAEASAALSDLYPQLPAALCSRLVRLGMQAMTDSQALSVPLALTTPVGISLSAVADTESERTQPHQVACLRDWLVRGCLVTRKFPISDLHLAVRTLTQ